MKLIDHFTIGAICLLLILGGCKSELRNSVKATDGVRINFDNEGKGKPAIILVHGWANTNSIWYNQVSVFAEKYQVIAVDLPGFGKSGNNRSEWSISSYGDDISTIIHQLNLKKVVLVGFSLGGPVVIEAANNLPDRVIGVVLVDNLHEIDMKMPPPLANLIDSTMMDLINDPTKEKLVAGGYFISNIDSASQQLIPLLKGSSHIGWRESLLGMIKWQNEHCTNSITSVKAPIIAINNDKQPTNVEAFRKYSPTFKAKIVKDVGHLIMWDNPKAFNQLLEECIQEFNSM